MRLATIAVFRELFALEPPQPGDGAPVDRGWRSARVSYWPGPLHRHSASLRTACPKRPKSTAWFARRSVPRLASRQSTGARVARNRSTGRRDLPENFVHRVRPRPVPLPQPTHWQKDLNGPRQAWRSPQHPRHDRGRARPGADVRTGARARRQVPKTLRRTSAHAQSTPRPVPRPLRGRRS